MPHKSKKDDRAIKVTRKPSQTDDAVELIRSKIIDLSLPQGSRIDERLLIDQFKLGRTPAREAINRLQAEGLVTIVPDRGGKFVRDLDMREIGEIISAHQVAESMLGSLCSFEDRRLVDDLNAIQKRYEKAVSDRMYLDITEVNQEFHLRIFQSIDNSFLFEFAQSVHRHVRRLLVMLYRLEASKPNVHNKQFEANVAQHWKIIELIEASDRNALKSVLPDHAVQTQKRLSAFLEDQAQSGDSMDIKIQNFLSNKS